MRFVLVSLFVCLSFSGFSQIKLKLSELSGHVGDSIITEGKVTDVKYDENSFSTYLNIGAATSKNSVTILIQSANRYKFSVIPEAAYKNKSIRVAGKLLNDNGKLQIIVYDPSQIVLIDKK